MKHLLTDFIQVTEAAALSVYNLVGKGDKVAADAAATSAMREKLNEMEMNAVVVIGEGEMDNAPMLAVGERLGSGKGMELDIAVDPLEGTNAAIFNKNNAMSVIAVAPKGSLLKAPDIYMQKIAVGPEAKGVIDIDAPIEENVKNIAYALDKSITEITVTVQDRERHREIVEKVINVGAKVQLFNVNDIVAGMTTIISSDGFDGDKNDLFIGTGGAPEGVILSVALKCLGGDMQVKLLPKNEKEYQRCLSMGICDPKKTLTLNDIVSSNECLFVATGITDSSLLRGVRPVRDGIVTHSLFTFGDRGKLTYIETLYQRGTDLETKNEGSCPIGS